MSTIDKIRELKKQRDAVILAHYYVDDEVQAIADYVGDSFYLSKVATTVEAETILFCGVSFMGESAKILNPEKTVIMPDMQADCPMAHMAESEKIEKMRREYEDLAVVCYINSTAELKTYADVCVTSSNAVKIVRALPNRHIYFIPDKNLGRYAASQVPEKHFIFNEGFCHVHTGISAEHVRTAKEAHPDAEILVHPECTPDVTALADYIGSTSGIIDFAAASAAKEFIICTETGVLYELKQKNPQKRFYSAGHRQFCPDMKRISLEKVADALESMSNTIELEEETRLLALRPLERMLALGN
ncbi:MAG: quinolinate synthase NadA [Lachnospiraceae bacterium]|jgi:quinolinate synthase|nr:quinolinate synthase NadA [Lachnospiraceae bacterium]